MATRQIALEPGSRTRDTEELSVVVVDHNLLTSRRAAAALVAGGIPVAAIWRSPDEVLTAEAADLGSGVAVLCCDPGRSADMTTLRRLRKRLHDTRIVVVAHSSGRRHAREALNTGADGFIVDRDIESALATVVRTVAAGHVAVPRGLRRHVVRPAFSHRERQVLALMARGMQNREIADRLYLAESTIKSHLASAFEKLGVRSRKEASALILDPDEGLRALVFGERTPSVQPAEEDATR